jgi:hypothetical protein
MQLYSVGIMNSQGSTQGPPGLVAPPQMVDPNQQQGGPQHMGYPNSPQPPSSYPNGPSPQNGPPPQQPGKHKFLSRFGPATQLKNQYCIRIATIDASGSSHHWS